MSALAQTPPAATPVIIESREGAVVTLTLNRPERLNALNSHLAVALNEALQRIAADDNIRVVVLTGAGRAFCAGGDLALIGKGRQENDSSEIEPILRSGMNAVLKIRTMRQPVIAAVNGPAAGAGMNIALAADLRIASEMATFGENFANVGLFPDYGGTIFLPELVGPAKAAELFYTGEMIGAQEALRLGIVNRVVAVDKLELETKALARKIAQGPPLAVRAVKRSLFAASEEKLAEALAREAEEQMKCFHSQDCSEGIRAFFEKRSPKFQGR